MPDVLIRTLQRAFSLAKDTGFALVCRNGGTAGPAPEADEERARADEPGESLAGGGRCVRPRVGRVCVPRGCQGRRPGRVVSRPTERDRTQVLPPVVGRDRALP